VPTYQYACTSCGHQLEAVQSFADEPLTQCPACEGRLRKLFSSVGIVFKGSGFYRTDSRNGSAGGSTGSAGNGSAEASKGASGDAADKAGKPDQVGKAGKAGKEKATKSPASGSGAAASASSAG
jgi:putative FmdB family regulatory protein